MAKKRGAPPGNQNARKHGLYSRALTEAQKLTLERVYDVEGLDDEIALLRIRLLGLVEEAPGRLDLQLQVTRAIDRLIRTRYEVSKEQKRSLKEAMQKVLTEVGIPLGLGAVIGSMKR
jgi:hypothetical protein